jgi:hypothetical protein
MGSLSEMIPMRPHVTAKPILGRAILALASMAMLVGPERASADRGAFTVEGGPTGRLGSMPPSVGAGDSVTGTTGGGTLGVRFALTHRLEVHARGFYDAPGTFVHYPVLLSTGSGEQTGALTQELSRWGAAAGIRLIVAGLVWRIPVGVELGWAHTRLTDRAFVNLGDGTPIGPRLGNQSRDQLLVAPFLGLEWEATDHLSFSVLPRLEFVTGTPSTVGVVVPVMVGWSWYGL